MGTLQASMTALPSSAWALSATHFLCHVANTAGSWCFLQKHNPQSKSASSFCTLPMQPWETNPHRVLLNQHTNKGGRCCHWLPLRHSDDRHMRFSNQVVVQATACTAPYAACSIECADVNSHCCAGSPQPHAEQMHVSVPGGLSVSR